MYLIDDSLRPENQDRWITKRCLRPTVVVILLVLGLLAAGVSSATAQAPVDSTAAAADSTAAAADSTVAAPDSTAAPTPPPAAPAPAPVTPPPAPVPAAAAVATPPPAPAPAPAAASTSAPNDRIYYGGTVTLSFGSTSRIGIFPMVGYKLTPKLSGGVEVGYEYVSYDNDLSAHNYGGSVFGRFRVGRNLYAHAEYQAINFEVFTGPNSSDRQWVPFLLVGGGFTKPISARTSIYAEVLVDVLQDENSPYEDWEPVVNVGVGVGF